MTPQSLDDGEFDICASCPPNKNCCSKVGEGAQVAAPFIMEHEASEIARATGLPKETFATTSATSSKIEALRTLNRHCYFYDVQNGKCSIYDSRPFDCRLFPFDVMKTEEGRFYWIMYQELCPPTFQLDLVRDRYFERAKRVLARANVSKDDLSRFAVYGAETMQKNRFRVLQEVLISG